VRVFATNPTPNEDILGALARRTGLDVAIVSRWFRNQRHYHRLQRRWQVDALLGLNVVPLRESRRLHRGLPTDPKAVPTSPIQATARRAAAGARTAAAAEAEASARAPAAKPEEPDAASAAASAAAASSVSSAPAMYVQTGAIIPPDRTVSPPPFGAPLPAAPAAGPPVASGRPIPPPCPPSDQAWAAIHSLAAKLDGTWQAAASLPSYEQLVSTGVAPAAVDRRVLSLLALVFDRHLEYLIALAYRAGLVDAPTAARAAHGNRHMLGGAAAAATTAAATAAAAAAAAPAHAPAPAASAPPPMILQRPPLHPAPAPANPLQATPAAAGAAAAGAAAAGAAAAAASGATPPGWAPHAWPPSAAWAPAVPTMVYRPQPIRICPPTHPAAYPTPPASAPSSTVSSARSSWSSLSDFASGGPAPPVAPIAPVVRPPAEVAGAAGPHAYAMPPPPLGAYPPAVAASFSGML